MSKVVELVVLKNWIDKRVKGMAEGIAAVKRSQPPDYRATLDEAEAFLTAYNTMEKFINSLDTPEAADSVSLIEKLAVEFIKMENAAQKARLIYNRNSLNMSILVNDGSAEKSSQEALRTTHLLEQMVDVAYKCLRVAVEEAHGGELRPQ